MIAQCGHEDCKRSNYAGCLHDSSPLNTALMIGEMGQRTLKAEREIEEINGKILGQLSQILVEAVKMARRAEGCEAEIAELMRVRTSQHVEIEGLRKRNEYLEHELVALGHVNCEWCLYWKQDEDSSDEGVCELAGKSPWGMFRIDHREYGQAMAGHVLKTLIDFGCKEGKAKPYE